MQRLTPLRTVIRRRLMAYAPMRRLMAWHARRSLAHLDWLDSREDLSHANRMLEISESDQPESVVDRRITQECAYHARVTAALASRRRALHEVIGEIRAMETAARPAWKVTP